MLYKIVRPVARIALCVTFRKIYFSGATRIPDDKPVILAINHPTSFIEPCLLSVLLPMPLYFLARGNLFNKAWAAKILKAFHIFPIYRKKDGSFGQIKNNIRVLDKSFDAIARGKTFLIMAEGNCIQEKRLRPLRKGTARLAFGSIDKYPDLDTHIVAVGVNYTYPDDFRSEVMFDFGKPIPVQNFMDTYRVAPQKAIKQLTAKLEDELRPLVIIIEKKEDEDLAEFFFTLYRNENDHPILPIIEKHNPKRLQSEISIARSINDFSEEKKTLLKKEIQQYEQMLKEEKVTDWAILHPSYFGWLSLFIAILGFMPFAIGYLGNYLPIKLAAFIKNNYVAEVEDKMSVAIVVGLAATLLYYLLLAIICFLYGNVLCIAFITLLPFWGYFALIYKEYVQKCTSALKAKNCTSIEKLLYKREEVKRLLDDVSPISK